MGVFILLNTHNWMDYTLFFVCMYLFNLIEQQDLMYSTGNSTQYSVIACTGKESEKE